MNFSSRAGKLPSMLPNGLAINPYRTWLLVNHPRKYTARLRERFGKFVTFFVERRMFGLILGGETFVVVLTPEGARQVLAGNPDGYDAFWKDGFTGVAGPGSLWVLGGEKHRFERQMLSPAFHAQNLRSYGKIIRQITREKLRAWKPGQTLRALDPTLAISLDVIMRLVFGVEDEQFSQEGRKALKKLWKNMHPLIVFFPHLQAPWFPLWRRYSDAKNEFSAWVSLYLAERRSSPKKDDDVLGQMLSARDEDGKPMQDEHIRDELITILLAGHETTATALAWALYELGRHPAEVKKLRAELDSLGPDPDPNLIPKLPYLSAVCNETLRLHTLLPEVARVLVSPLKLFGHTLPAGDSVAISIMSIHHDPELYPEPDEFIPERFIGRTYSPFEFLPFGGGHRRCLGSGLSDYEMRIALAEIASHWNFEPATVEIETRHDIAMGPKNGVPLRILGQRIFSTPMS